MRSLSIFASLLLLAGCAQPLAPRAAAPGAGGYAAAGKQHPEGRAPLADAAGALMARCHQAIAPAAATPVDAAGWQAYLGCAPEDAARLVQFADTTGDGALDRAEAQAWGRYAGPAQGLAERVLTPPFARADWNQDGAMDPEEAIRATWLADGPSVDVTGTDFLKADKDRSGDLSPREFEDLAAGKLATRKAYDNALDRRLAQVWLKALPWSH